MDTVSIYEIVCRCGDNAEILHQTLISCVPSDPKQPLETGWPSCLLCIQLLNAALEDFNRPDERHRIYMAMNTLLNWPLLRLAAASSKKHSQTASFKAIIKLVFGDIWNVRGDGNCFFRAVVKGSFAPGVVPTDLESTYAQTLREQLNPIKGDRERAREAEEMSKSGVWADFVQVVKAAKYLNRPIFVITCEDRNLVFDVEQGTVVPGELLRAYPSDDDDTDGSEKKTTWATPLFLHFDPYGHYEPVVPKSQLAGVNGIMELEFLLKEVEKQAESAKPNPYLIQSICWAYFALVHMFDDIEKRLDDCKNESYDIKRVIYEDLVVMAGQVMTGIRRLKNALCHFSPAVMREVSAPALSFHMFVLGDLFDDDLAFIDDMDEPFQRGNGPLSKLLKHAEEMVKNKPSKTKTMASNAVKSVTDRVKNVVSKPNEGSMYAPAPVQEREPATKTAQRNEPTLKSAGVPVSSWPAESAKPSNISSEEQRPQFQVHSDPISGTYYSVWNQIDQRKQQQQQSSSSLNYGSILQQDRQPQSSISTILGPAQPSQQSQGRSEILVTDGPPQNSLISDPTTTVLNWDALYIPGSVLQFACASVDEIALNSLFEFLQKRSRIDFIEFHKCRFNDSRSTQLSLERIASLSNIKEIILDCCDYEPSFSQSAAEKIRIIVENN